MKFSLYEIDQMVTEAIEAINAEAETNDGVYDEEWDKILDGLQIDRTKKLLDCARYVKSLEGMAEAVKAEKLALADRQKAYETKADHIRAYISRSLVAGEKAEDANTKLSWRKSESVEITDEKQIPSQYVECKYIPIKTDIKTAIKSGKEIPGARIVEKQSIQIK
jgi:hypothetical protein